MWGRTRLHEKKQSKAMVMMSSWIPLVRYTVVRSALDLFYFTLLFVRNFRFFTRTPHWLHHLFCFVLSSTCLLVEAPALSLSLFIPNPQTHTHAHTVAFTLNVDSD